MAANTDDPRVKAHKVTLLVSGSEAVGKSSMIYAYLEGRFSTEYVPTVFNVEHAARQLEYCAPLSKVQPKNPKKRLPPNQLHTEEITVDMSIFDTAGRKEYDHLRQLQYPQMDLLLMCFPLVADDASATDEIVKKWVPEVKHHAPNKPFILVGTKADLRGTEEAKSKHETSTADGKALADRIGAWDYVETSAKTDPESLKQLFKTAYYHYTISLFPA
eukprot:CAMPEP_0174240476 /NCGR_PEP_ID=MMETSP0417-20130205/19014_1 /TAXON_ID=242541 /ORGANISM="Mayorella sp, Strain BSH-02190019" /LENGTH=216 /DNA_ID=CAMNT_0015319571 /DNA_START=57 /DNA_END=703 /DNA_ORIENTATION=+